MAIENMSQVYNPERASLATRYNYNQGIALANEITYTVYSDSPVEGVDSIIPLEPEVTALKELSPDISEMYDRLPERCKWQFLDMWIAIRAVNTIVLSSDTRVSTIPSLLDLDLIAVSYFKGSTSIVSNDIVWSGNEDGKTLFKNFIKSAMSEILVRANKMGVATQNTVLVKLNKFVKTNDVTRIKRDVIEEI